MQPLSLHPQSMLNTDSVASADVEMSGAGERVVGQPPDLSLVNNAISAVMVPPSLLPLRSRNSFHPREERGLAVIVPPILFPLRSRNSEELVSPPSISLSSGGDGKNTVAVGVVFSPIRGILALSRATSGGGFMSGGLVRITWADATTTHGQTRRRHEMILDTSACANG